MRFVPRITVPAVILNVRLVPTITGELTVNEAPTVAIAKLKP